LNLGFMFGSGRGVTQSEVEAAEWYRKAADQGNEIAQCNLGSFHEEGRGVAQSDEEAARLTKETHMHNTHWGNCLRKAAV